MIYYNSLLSVFDPWARWDMHLARLRSLHAVERDLNCTFGSTLIGEGARGGAWSLSFGVVGGCWEGGVGSHPRHGPAAPRLA